MIYLSGPYTHPNPDIRHTRYQLLSQLACNLMKNSDYVFSPITHGHAMEIEAKDLVPYHKWMVHSLLMLEKCDMIFVAELPGWQESKGVDMEIDYAKAHNKFIQYISPEIIVSIVDKSLYQKHQTLLNRITLEKKGT